MAGALQQPDDHQLTPKSPGNAVAVPAEPVVVFNCQSPQF
jgi:hypothetical protein